MAYVHNPMGASIYDWDEQYRLVKLKTPDSTIKHQSIKRTTQSRNQNGHIIRYQYNTMRWAIAKQGISKHPLSALITKVKPNF